MIECLGETMGLLEEHYRTKSPREKGEAQQAATNPVRNDAAE